MRHLISRLALLGAGAALAISTGSAAAAGVRTSGQPGWRVVFRANLAQSNQIIDVTAVSRDDAWAIGVVGRHGYAVHWDGTRWRASALPRGFAPEALHASSPANVWIAGLRYKGKSAVQATLHWNGGNWQVMQPPPLRGGNVALAVGAASAWAFSAGAWTPANGWQFVAAFWNGTSWARESFPGLGPAPQVGASRGGAVWAAGTTSRALTPTTGRLVAYQWTGHGWHRQHMANPPVQWSGVTGVGVASSTSVWLATISTSTRHGGHRDILWHWDGTRLTRLPEPESGGGPVSSDGHGGAWLGPLAHWTGRSWQYPLRDARCMLSGPGMAVSAIPNTRSAWAADGCVTSSSPHQGEIELFGPRP